MKPRQHPSSPLSTSGHRTRPGTWRGALPGVLAVLLAACAAPPATEPVPPPVAAAV